MTPPLTPDGFKAATGVSRETLDRLTAYARLLEKWTRRINLVSRASLADLWRRHLLDSAQLMNHLPPPPPDRPRVVIDLGSGAGLPGLVLAILGAGEIHLVESDQRKAAFLREAGRAAGCVSPMGRDSVTVHNCRIEDLTPFPVDLVTARALAPLPKLIGLAEGFLLSRFQPSPPPGHPIHDSAEQTDHPLALFLKGRGAAAELAAAREKWPLEAESLVSDTDPSAIVLRLRLLDPVGNP